jgi:hypothetical protein
MGPYGAVYPQDELSKIKMRNRRFQQSCAMEGMHLYGPAIGPVWRGESVVPKLLRVGCGACTNTDGFGTCANSGGVVPIRTQVDMVHVLLQAGVVPVPIKVSLVHKGEYMHHC